MTLHTKYRPRTFDEVVGQGPVVKSLKQVVAKGTNRTILLVGPSGTGKTTLARIAASELGFLLQEIDAATHTGIDAMRDIMQTLNYRPLGGQKGKVLVIDECHRLSGQAWDSMLKTLEEPPPWLYFFLCTTDPAKVPKAVQTRCTAYTLRQVDDGTLFDLLDTVAAQEGVLGNDLGSKILNLCAKKAEGSPRQALVNLSACLSAKSIEEARELLSTVELDNAQAVELARLLMGNKSWQQIADLIKQFPDKDVEGVRHVVRAYVTTVALSGKAPTPRVLKMLESFTKPFYTSDGKSPLVLACAEVVFGE